ncbi:uncharacterized protein LOC122306261 [Carya illinoinensis]|uniref:uncharacterized protein LOC122306261 n=1 Tax=Carya illinoinensis TaxID=32201 RepID=UPI001C719882|nr:uncharacterized protein LOC122306261 [Carya illinoinensis]
MGRLLTWAKYWYNTSFHASIQKSPFEVVYGRSPPTLVNYEKCTARNDEVENELLTRDEILATLQPYGQATLKRKLNLKLSKRYYGPFKVLGKLGEVAYRLELPPTSKLHPIFHVTVLKKRIGDPKLIVEELPKFDEEGQMLLQPRESP